MAALEGRILTPSPKSPPDPPALANGHTLLAWTRRWGLSWQGWLDNRRGEWWLLAQLLLIAANLLPPWPAPGAWGYAWPLPLALAGAALVVLGGVLALQALWSLGFSLTPLPEPMPGAALVTTGAYARCRHPLYQALVLASFGWTLALGSVLHLGLCLVLSGVLRGKARREERALERQDPDYAAYRARTAAIIPGLPGLDWRRL